MKILGIDPGLATVGAAVIQGSDPRSMQFVDCCTIETTSGLSASTRLQEIAADLSELIKEHQPDVAVIEKLYFETNRKTAMQVAEARGVLLLTCEAQGLQIIEPTPLELKVAVTGYGKADKKQMHDMLSREFSLDLSGYGDDAVDALGLALYGVIRGKSVAVS